jgi:CheY-like chemotaxis protein
LPEENKPSPNTKLPILLIVEDNPEIQTFLRNSLSQQYNIITANHGQDAIEILKKHIPDIILSDLMMPVMNGNQLCATIKANPQFSDIPFILSVRTMTLRTA